MVLLAAPFISKDIPLLHGNGIISCDKDYKDKKEFLFRDTSIDDMLKCAEELREKHGIKVFVDSDGLIHDLIPWLIEAGIEGIFSLERQSGVDVHYIREHFPGFLMMGGFDKTIIHKGEPAITEEFEPLPPIMKTEGFIPSVDHQTPPDVSAENYKVYIKLFNKYAALAVR